MEPLLLAALLLELRVSQGFGTVRGVVEASVGIVIALHFPHRLPTFRGS
jgi:hypothetical protein